MLITQGIYFYLYLRWSDACPCIVCYFLFLAGLQQHRSGQVPHAWRTWPRNSWWDVQAQRSWPTCRVYLHHRSLFLNTSSQSMSCPWLDDCSRRWGWAGSPCPVHRVLPKEAGPCGYLGSREESFLARWLAVVPRGSRSAGKATAGRTSGSRRDTASLESGVPGAQGCCACSVVGDFPQAGGLPVWCRRELRAAAAALSSSTRNKLKALACSERYLKPIRIPLLLLPELCSLLSLIPTAVCCSA